MPRWHLQRRLGALATIEAEVSYGSAMTVRRDERTRGASGMPGVLVIDDDRSVVPLIRSACKQVGVEVIAADSAEKGLEIAREQKPDVVLLDVMLPGVSGLELFDRVRKHDERLPVIFMTAS